MLLKVPEYSLKGDNAFSKIENRNKVFSNQNIYRNLEYIAGEGEKEVEVTNERSDRTIFSMMYLQFRVGYLGKLSSYTSTGATR